MNVGGLRNEYEPLPTTTVDATLAKYAEPPTGARNGANTLSLVTVISKTVNSSNAAAPIVGAGVGGGTGASVGAADGMPAQQHTRW